MKRSSRIMTAFFLCAALLLCACGRSAVPETWCGSLQEAEKLIGFRLRAPEDIDGSGTKTFSAAGRTLEIMYFDGKVLNGRISKADNGENIGVYDYGYTEVTEVKGGSVTYRLYSAAAGEPFHLAEWTKGRYSYLVLLGSGRSEEDMLAFCEGIR